MLTKDVMTAMWPHGETKIAGLLDAIVTASAVVFPKYGLGSDLLIAHAMAQFSQECGAGADVVENLNYSAQGLVTTWPGRFDAQKAAALAHNQRLIADTVYDGRMGNRPGTDDGWTYRGRGGSQVTGHDGYRKLGETVQLNLVNEPDLVNHPDRFLECAVADFVLCGCLPFAVHDDVQGVTYHLNGGYTGLSGRTAWLARWKAALKAQPAGAFGPVWVQQTLNQLGQEPPLVVDGSFGPVTVAAVQAFQHAHSLTADGKIGSGTITALQAALSTAGKSDVAAA